LAFYTKKKSYIKIHDYRSSIYLSALMRTNCKKKTTVTVIVATRIFREIFVARRYSSKRIFHVILSRFTIDLLEFSALFTLSRHQFLIISFASNCACNPDRRWSCIIPKSVECVVSTVTQQASKRTLCFK